MLHEITRGYLSNDKDTVDQVNDVVMAMRGELYVDGALPADDRIDEFLGFCAGIISDGKVWKGEALAIKRRFELDPELALKLQVARIYQVVADALMDGKLDDDETRDIRKWINRLAGDGYSKGGPASYGAAPHLPDMIVDHAMIAFEGRVFVVAGALCIAPGYEIAAMISAKGGELADAVSPETHFVIAADDAARGWTAADYGAEIEAARRLIARGGGLRFVSERGFEAALRSKTS